MVDQSYFEVDQFCFAGTLFPDLPPHIKPFQTPERQLLDAHLLAPNSQRRFIMFISGILIEDSMPETYVDTKIQALLDFMRGNVPSV
jgi:hypothetical protein